MVKGPACLCHFHFKVIPQLSLWTTFCKKILFLGHPLYNTFFIWKLFFRRLSWDLNGIDRNCYIRMWQTYSLESIQRYFLKIIIVADNSTFMLKRKKWQRIYSWTKNCHLLQIFAIFLQYVHIFAIQQWRPYCLGLYAVLKPSVL